VSTKAKCIGMLTAPRYVATWPTRVIQNAFARVGIPLKISGGVFYQQCMQQMFEESCNDGTEVVITCDMDSIFADKHIFWLLDNLLKHEHIDALAALQSRRGMANPLLSVETDAKVGDSIAINFEGEPLKVKTAHFGLTALRVDKLRDMPKPWFMCMPDENGSYGDKRVEADIFFWKEWEKHGNTVYVDSSVSIGHMEEMVSGFDDNGEHCFWYPQDYRSEFL
jgi:hypothetical protein